MSIFCFIHIIKVYTYINNHVLNVEHSITLKKSFSKQTDDRFYFQNYVKKHPSMFATSWDGNRVTLTPLLPSYFSGKGVTLRSPFL